MRTTTGSVHRHPTDGTTQAYSPSVPLSVYRDLASELQSVEARLDTLTAQNQQLVQENQLLRQEIAKAVESVLHLQKLIDSQSKDSHRSAVQPSFHPINQPKQPVSKASSKKQTSRPRPPVVVPHIEISSPIPEPVFIEEQEASYYLQGESELMHIHSWWFIMAILLIIVLGFGAGYLIVRPILEQHSR